MCSEAAEEGGEEEAPPDPEILANKFRSLVLERYVERAPPCNLPPPTQQVRTLRYAWAEVHCPQSSILCLLLTYVVPCL